MKHVQTILILLVLLIVAPTVYAQMSDDEDKSRWRRDLIHPNYSPVDLSFLNAPEAPAGKRGFVRPQGEKLIFSDGTEARFWGTNIQAFTLFQTKPSQIRTHAKRLSKLGFNLVRIHHHDSVWVTPNIFGDENPSTRTLDESALKLIDMWISMLKEEGIYVWLDLNVGREFTETDGIENFDEIVKNRMTTSAKGFNFIDKDIERLSKEFNQSYLEHVNEYTGLVYKDDPAIIAILITNENDITYHFGNSLLPDKNVPNANKTYMALAEQFAEKHGLSSDQTWRSWEFGPSKLFLNDLEHQYFERMTDHLNSLNVQNMIVNTNSWGSMPLSSLPSLTGGDLVDVHSYGKEDFLRTDPRYVENFIHWFGASHVNGKPLTISEWNLVPFPETFDRFAAPVYVAATSALQGWDGMMQYGYAQQPLNNEGFPSNYSTFNDPGSIAMMPAAALLYRQGHVSEAQKTYVFSPDSDQFFGQLNSPVTSSTIRTLIEQSKFVIDIPKTKELPWFNAAAIPEDAIVVSDPNQNFVEGDSTIIRSDTGELSRDWMAGIYTVNSPKSQIAMGWIGDEDIRLNDISMNISNRMAAVAVQSLDQQDLANSDNILISMASRTDPSPDNSMPFLSEPIEGFIYVKAKAGLKLFMKNRYGGEQPLPVDYADGQYTITINRDVKSYWLVLKKVDDD